MSDTPGCIRRHGRVLLRLADDGDRDEFIALREASGRFLTRWEPIPKPGNPALDPIEGLFMRYLERDNERSVRMLLVRHEDRTILGSVNINEISRGAFQNCAIGWWIGREHARQGFMREGLSAALDHVFLDLELHRAEANIQPNNAPSLALAKHAGMRHEGFSKRYLKIDGQWCDHERWAITTEEWREQRGE